MGSTCCCIRPLTAGPVMLPVLQAFRHFLFGASAYLVISCTKDRAQTHFPGVCGSECKVYPGFQCKSTAIRHSSRLVGSHRKKMHVRERAAIPAGRFQLNACGIYGFL